jgi:hypothetical protein
MGRCEVLVFRTQLVRNKAVKACVKNTQLVKSLRVCRETTVSNTNTLNLVLGLLAFFTAPVLTDFDSNANATCNFETF